MSVFTRKMVTAVFSVITCYIILSGCIIKDLSYCECHVFWGMCSSFYSSYSEDIFLLKNRVYIAVKKKNFMQKIDLFKSAALSVLQQHSS